MSKNSIRLSKKHGLNPSMMICPLCGKNLGIALFGHLKGDEQAPMQVYGEPCEDCMIDVVEKNRVLVVGIKEEEQQVIGFAVVNREPFGDTLPENEYVAPMKEKDFKEMCNQINSNKNDDNI